MIALSATFPSENNIARRIFGDVFSKSSEITSIPVKIIDYKRSLMTFNKKSARENIKKTYLEDTIEYSCDEEVESEIQDGKTAEEYYSTTNSRERFLHDSSFEPLDDCDVVIHFSKRIPPLSSDYKGIVLCYTINSSVFASLYLSKVCKANVLLVREFDKSSYYIRKSDHIPKFSKDITFEDFKQLNIGEKCNNEKYMKEVEIIVGTFHRLKEGFNVENITWGICTKFVYSLPSRIQILGRVRRSSKNPLLNAHERIFFVASGKEPNNYYQLLKSSDEKYASANAHCSYDYESENVLFQDENYIYIADEKKSI
jgi:hypothetical protein